VADLSDTLHRLVDDLDAVLPPSAEVRRQGDRIRLRRTVLTVLVTLVLLALAATGLFLLGEVDSHGYCRSVAGTTGQGACDGRG
jgi:hypothetical protein